MSFTNEVIYLRFNHLLGQLMPILLVAVHPDVWHNITELNARDVHSGPEWHCKFCFYYILYELFLDSHYKNVR